MRPSSAAAEEQNAFDVVRLGLAWLVVYSHACLLGGFGEEGFARFARGQTIAGTLAVLGFFGLSGFLVTRSFALRGDWRHFAAARLLRILPGFYLALLLTAFVLAPLIAAVNTADGGWSPAAALRFVGRNLGVRVGEWHVGDVTAGLPYVGSINGALWSLFPELCCYGLVLALGLAGALGRGRATMALAAGAMLVLHVALVVAPTRPDLAPTLLALTGWAPFVTAFLTGAVLYAWRDAMDFGLRAAMLWGVVALVLLRFGGWALLGPVVLPLVAINAAYAARVRLRADFSYGIYVLHFPVLQLLAALGWQAHGFAVFLAAGTVASVLLAAASWYLVEKPALKLKGFARRG